MANRYEVAERLSEVGAKVDPVSEYENTPLRFAKNAALLLTHEADVNAKAKSKSQKTPLDMTDKPDLKAFLISAGGLSAK